MHGCTVTELQIPEPAIIISTVLRHIFEVNVVAPFLNRGADLSSICQKRATLPLNRVTENLMLILVRMLLMLLEHKSSTEKSWRHLQTASVESEENVSLAATTLESKDKQCMNMLKIWHHINLPGNPTSRYFSFECRNTLWLPVSKSIIPFQGFSSGTNLFCGLIPQ